MRIYYNIFLLFTPEQDVGGFHRFDEILNDGRI